jgi:cytochrome c5
MSSDSGDHQVAGTIKNAIAVFAASIGLVLIIFMLAQYAVGSYAGRARHGDASMSETAVAERLKPVGEVHVDANAAAPVAVAAAIPATAPVAVGASGADQGKTTYEAVCAACHAGGVAGAPKTGDKAIWGPRIEQGNDTLYASALKGKGVMPAKGGNPGLGDAAVKAAVDYLVAQAK